MLLTTPGSLFKERDLGKPTQLPLTLSLAIAAPEARAWHFICDLSHFPQDANFCIQKFSCLKEWEGSLQFGRWGGRRGLHFSNSWHGLIFEKSIFVFLFTLDVNSFFLLLMSFNCNPCFMAPCQQQLLIHVPFLCLGIRIMMLIPGSRLNFNYNSFCRETVTKVYATASELPISILHSVATIRIIIYTVMVLFAHGPLTTNCLAIFFESHYTYLTDR